MNPIIRTALERILAPVDAAWEKSIVDAYVAAAHAQMEQWAAYLAAPEPKVWSHREKMPQYVRWTRPADHVEDYRPTTHAVYQQRLAAGQYSADVKDAAKDGKHQYHLIREAFLLRVGETIDNVIQTKHASILGEIHFGRRIEGHLTITTKPDTFFRLKVSVKTNYRYGHNSANGRLTVYGQYPVLFDAATVNGEAVSDRLSEALLANLISGIPVDRKIRATQDQKDAKEAIRAERDQLDRKRDMYAAIEDIYNSILYHETVKVRDQHDAKMVERCTELIAGYRAKLVEVCTRHGITDPGSKKAAFAERKSILAQIKALKAAKQEV